MWVIPFHSSDLYGYLNRGFQQSVLHTNPYATPIADIPGWRQWAVLHPHWIDNPCPYGFFFTAAMAWLTAWSGTHFVLAFVGFKLLDAGLFLGSVALMVGIARRLALPNPSAILFWFAVNPLVLLHGIANGHNDLWMMILVLLSLWVLTNQRAGWLALPLLMLSVLVKYASLILLPFWSLFLWKERRWFALAGGWILAGLMLGVLAASYIDPASPWLWKDMLDNAGKPQHSLIALIGDIGGFLGHFAFHIPLDMANRAVTSGLKPLFWVLFAGFYVQQCWMLARQAVITLPMLLAASARVLLVLVVIASAKFHPWYILMFLPLALLLPSQSRTRRIAESLSLWQMAGFTFVQNIPMLGVLLLTIFPTLAAWKGSTPQATRSSTQF